MISANLKSIQGTLKFLGKIQELDDERIIQEGQTRPKSKRFHPKAKQELEKQVRIRFDASTSQM